jgi:DNA processing protein
VHLHPDRPAGLTADDRLACAALTHLTDPANPLLGALLTVLRPADVLSAIRTGSIPAGAAGVLGDARAGRLRPTLARWRAQLPDIALAADLLARAADGGIRLVCPGDPGWPAQLEDLGTARPYALWVRGAADLPSCTARSVAIIGSRAATAYGTHVCTELAAELAARGWTIVSGGAYGIDAAAHRAALAVSGTTLAVLACGPDSAFPRQHRGMFDAIAATGAVISEWPPGTQVSRQRLLLRNRVIAALAGGTLVVEAAEHSGTIAAARQAENLGRPLLAVPGAVPSAMSAGCHALIRDQRAICVTSAGDVMASVPEAAQ